MTSLIKEGIRLEEQNHKRNLITASFIDSYCSKELKAIVFKIPGILNRCGESCETEPLIVKLL